MKKLLCLIMAVVFVFTSCSTGKYKNPNPFDVDDIKLTEAAGYDEYNDKVDKAITNVLLYFAYVKEAYNNADGKYLKSFVLSEEANRYLENAKAIEYDIHTGTAVIILQLLRPALLIAIKESERDLLVVGSDNGNPRNEEWFAGMHELLTKAYDIYSNGEYLVTKEGILISPEMADKAPHLY